MSWLLYGANGYTGELIAREAVDRGMRPILAGRNAPAVERLATELGCEKRIFGLQSRSEILAQLHGISAVLHCAGPFSRTAEPMMDACLDSGVHYLDITGEIDVIEAAAARHERARRAGVALVPAVGFDVVPSDCLAALVASRLSEACLLQIAFAGTGGVSRGTLKTMFEALPQGGRARSGGRIERVPVAWKTMRVPFRDGPKWAMTIPWGDVASAYYSTGVTNIEVYLAASRGQIVVLKFLRIFLPVLKWRPIADFLQHRIERFVTGPKPDERERAQSSFWCQAAENAGGTTAATLLTAGSYELTVRTSLAAMERILQGRIRTGFATPSQAFGKEFILSIPGSDFRWEQPAADASV